MIYESTGINDIGGIVYVGNSGSYLSTYYCVLLYIGSTWNDVYKEYYWLRYNIDKKRRY